MTVPSVKGAMILGAVVVARRARDRGRVPEERLAKLSDRSRELLEEQIQLSRWYPMELFTELLELDWEIGGNFEPEYMRKSGEKNAERMTRAARYQQFDYLERAERPKSNAEVIKQVRLTSSVTLSYFNFMEVEVRMHPDRPNVLQIVYSNTESFPDALRYSTEGFMSRLNRVRGSSRRWTSERVGNTVVFALEIKERQDPRPG